MAKKRMVSEKLREKSSWCSRHQCVHGEKTLYASCIFPNDKNKKVVRLVSARNFKFRRWSHYEGKMYGNALAGGNVFDSDIMQDTGLTDKNGKSVFEGDILSNGEDKNTLVKFKNGSFVVCANGEEELLGRINLLKEEVVGNIYENTDLLEEVK